MKRYSKISFIVINLILVIAACLCGAYLVGFYNANSVEFVLSPVTLLLAIVFQLLASWLTAVIWIQLLSDEGSKLSLGESFAQMGVVLVAKYVPGKIWGQVVRGGILFGKGYSKRKIVQASIFEQFVAIHSGSIISLCIYTLFYHFYLLIPCLVVCLGSIIYVEWLYGLANKFVGWLARVLKMQWNAEIQSGFSAIQLKSYIACFAMNCVVWCALGVILLLIVASQKIELSFSDAVYVAGMLPVSVIVGFVALFAPGGIGVRDGMLVLLLAPVLGLDVAAISTLFFRVWSTVLDLCFGVYSFFFLVRHHLSLGENDE